ncbi:MAG: DUF1090 domain-containing protein [Enterobacteriaceae bacterium]|jgi:DNA repair exonuclease SbcCD ATPase subunit|nr:DUF1090 domain-containing protein [Enterobacteriaceae bacterium]
MKTITKVVLLPLVLVAISAGSASAKGKHQGGCESKIAKLNEQITQAKAENNTDRVTSLESALSQVTDNCNAKNQIKGDVKKFKGDTKAALDPQKQAAKLEKRVQQGQENIKKIEADKQKALDAGKAKQAAKLDKKLEAEKARLTKFEEQLNQASGTTEPAAK